MKSALYIYLTAFCALTVSCSETKKQDEANPTTKQDGQNDQPIEGRLELGHKPGTKDSTAYFIKYGNKKYYFMDEVANLDSYQDKRLFVSGDFEEKDFPGVIYIKESDLHDRDFIVPQGIIYSDREEYEENRTYYQIIDPVIKIKEG